MSTFLDELVAAAGRHGIPCLVLNAAGGNGAAPPVDDDDDVESVSAPFITAPGAPADQGEVDQLRAQVQKLTAELANKPAQAVVSTGGATIPAGDHGSIEGLSIETLGFEEDALTKKLMRSGFETIGKLRDGFMGAKLADEGLKLKKDWLIEVGMKLAGSGPSSAGPAGAVAPAGGAAPSAEDVPGGHKDQPWLQRLAAARQKQYELGEVRKQLAEKQAEAAKLTKARKAIPSDLDDEVVKLEDSISLAENTIKVLRWSMNLDFDPAITLDQALQKANLGPWMESPQPRLAPPA